MRIKWLAATLLTLIATDVTPAHAMDEKTSQLLDAALTAQGGEEALRAIQSIQWEAVGYRNALEQSERPEGPYLTEFDTLAVVHDFAHHRLAETTQATNYPIDQATTGIVIDDGAAMLLAGGRKRAGTPQQMQVALEREALSPERLLLTALEAKDVHREPDMVLQSVMQNVLAFTLDGFPVHIYLNSDTHLPTAVDYSGPTARDGYWAFLGDVTHRTYYGFWWIAKGGLRLPLQANIECNGLPSRMTVIRKLQINSPLDEAQVTIPTDIRSQFNPNAPARTYDDIPLGIPGQPEQEIADGVIFIPGRWNVTLVRQDDGVVVIEAPISSGYSAKVIEEAHRRFPSLSVKAVITTSDSWPHLAGIREYVADGIPVYALNRNRPILNRVITMPYTSRPDKQQRSPRKPQFHLVNEKTALGTGANRLELYPIHGETSERQLMVYFPEHHLLYGSDPFQRMPNGLFFYPQTVSELLDAVKREHLDVQKFFMMHIYPTDWSELMKAIQTAKDTDTPNGELM